ncbi:hypothetical protein ACMGGS_20940 [Superficieibacter sp. BNK-5]|uniref:hypothetical protein n=1 Tax=Superficieibacter sp. BNK-5 TaxID=3376142 RepID=UPI0039BF07C4
MNEYKLSILVILYNKEINESNTINSLAYANMFFEKINLCIYNNGPNRIKENVDVFNNCHDFNLNIVQSLKNESLARIYNDFIQSNKSEKYLILDDDSIVNREFINAVLSARGNEVLIPIIHSGREVVGPEVNGELVSVEQQCAENDRVMSIGSGITLGNEVVNILHKKYGQVFDERFYLYGVDTTFFHRMYQLKLCKCIRIIAPINHSLSRLNVNGDELSHFRVKERGYDIGLQLRYYKSFREIIKSMSRLIIINTLIALKIKKGNINLQYVFKGFFSGKHYRES